MALLKKLMCLLQEMSKILDNRALSYLNVDTGVAGHDHISVATTPLLYHATYEAAKMVKHCILKFLNNEHFKMPFSIQCIVFAQFMLFCT